MSDSAAEKGYVSEAVANIDIETIQTAEESIEDQFDKSRSKAGNQSL